LALAAAEPAPPVAVEIATDPITGAMTAHATLAEDRNRLVVGCYPGRFRRVRVVLHSRRWLGRGGIFRGRQLTYRFDDDPPQRLIWTIRDRSAMLWWNERVRNFVASLGASERLIIRARDIEGQRFDMTFHTGNARAALDQVMQACGERPPSQ